MASASAWRKSISCWPIATSWWAASSSKPICWSVILDVAPAVLAEVERVDVEVRGGVVRIDGRRSPSASSLKRKNSASGPTFIV